MRHRVLTVLLALAASVALAGPATPAAHAAVPPQMGKYSPHWVIGADSHWHLAYFSAPVMALDASTPDGPPELSPDASGVIALNRYDHGWAPSPSSATRYFMHEHATEWYGATPNGSWRPWAALGCYQSGVWIKCNFAHTNFCAHARLSNVSEGCRDWDNRTGITGRTYYQGLWRAMNSGGSYIHATSSGSYDGVPNAGGVKARFVADNHLTNAYVGCSDDYQYDGSHNSWDWKDDCYGNPPGT